VGEEPVAPIPELLSDTPVRDSDKVDELEF